MCLSVCVCLIVIENFNLNLIRKFGEKTPNEMFFSLIIFKSENFDDLNLIWSVFFVFLSAIHQLFVIGFEWFQNFCRCHMFAHIFFWVKYLNFLLLFPFFGIVLQTRKFIHKNCSFHSNSIVFIVDSFALSLYLRLFLCLQQ